MICESGGLSGGHKPKQFSTNRFMYVKQMSHALKQGDLRFLRIRRTRGFANLDSSATELRKFGQVSASLSKSKQAILNFKANGLGEPLS